MNRPAIIWRDELSSTSTTLAAEAAGLGHGAVIAARRQTSGRGQRGNSWEAEPDKNLTFSILLRPRVVPPGEAFAVSMCTALSIVSVISEAMDGMDVKIKWPNDIYVGDRKICGILIENSFGSGIERSIVGVGINVNQREFLSDAPNPVSMWQLTGNEYNLEELLDRVADRMVEDFDAYEAAPDIEALTPRYRSRQWRGQGEWPWLDRITGEQLHAAILDIAPDGRLTLATEPPRSYAFKEVAAVL